MSLSPFSRVHRLLQQGLSSRLARGGAALPGLFLLGGLLSTPAAADSRLTNISVRSVAGSGANSLVVGFALAGTGTKPILIRGIGPGLTDFGVPGVVADPQLVLTNLSTGVRLAENDNWGTSNATLDTFASVGAFALKAGSRDAALLSTLPAGSYTGTLSATPAGGIALVEAYDADLGNTAMSISNLSARSVSEAGAGALTIGFNITGDTPRTVLIRAIGPGLTQFGLSGILPDPRLVLYNSSGVAVGLNDNWLSTSGWGPAFTAVGAFALSNGSRDAALLIRLPPGSYTAQTTDLAGGRGVALIEVYDEPSPPAASTVLTPAPVTFVPAVLTQARPSYPFELRVAGVEGQVIVDFIVDVDGRVTNAFVVSSPHALFSASALAAVQQWTFVPGFTDGRLARYHFQVPIVFTLN